MYRVGQRSNPNEKFIVKLPYSKPNSRWESVPNLESVLKLGKEVGIECSSISASNLFNGEVFKFIQANVVANIHSLHVMANCQSIIFEMVH